MATIKKICFLGLLLFLLACDKNNPPAQSDYSDGFRFFTELTVDGLPLRINVGEEDYKIYSDYSYADSTFHFSMLLAQDSSAPRRSLQIDFRSPKTGPSQEELIKALGLEIGKLAFSEPGGLTVRPHYYDYLFFGSAAGRGRWKMGDSINVLQDSFALNGVNSKEQTEILLKWSLSTTSPLQTCSEKVSLQLTTDQNHLATASAQLLNPTRCRLSINAVRGELQSVDWYWGDDWLGSGSSVDYTFGNTTRFDVRCQVVFSDGSVQDINREVNTQSLPCDFNIMYQRKAHRQYNPHNRNTVKISYYNESGKLFTSHYNHSNGLFEVINTGFFESPEDGNKYRRFSFNGQAMLRSEDGSTVQLSKLFGNIAFGD